MKFSNYSAKLVFILFGISIHSLWSANSFQAECYNRISNPQGYNTQVVVQLSDQWIQSLPSEAEIQIQFIQKQRVKHSIQRYVKLEEVSNQGQLIFPLTLKSGDYEVYITLTGNQPYKSEIQSLKHRVKSLNPKINLSDVYLTHPDGSLWLTQEVRADFGTLPFGVEMYAPTGKYFTIRAVLYRKTENLYTDDAGIYTSVRQINKVVQGSEKGFTFQHAFRTDENESGAYLIEIFVFEEDQIVAESHREVYLMWKEIPKILKSPQQWLAPLAVLIGKSGVETLRLHMASAPNPQDAFQSFWQNRNQDAYPYQAMESFYRRVMQAKNHLQHPTPWEQDMGASICIWGLPDSIIPYKVDQDSFQAWRYNSPPLYRYFIKPKGTSVYYLQLHPDPFFSI
jgi:GWxTD domain-containing protein